MLQWHPKLVALVVAIVVLGAAAGGWIESLANGLTW